MNDFSVVDRGRDFDVVEHPIPSLCLCWRCIAMSEPKHGTIGLHEWCAANERRPIRERSAIPFADLQTC